MKLKYYLRGAGIGIVATTLVFSIANAVSSANKKLVTGTEQASLESSVLAYTQKDTQAETTKREEETTKEQTTAEQKPVEKPTEKPAEPKPTEPHKQTFDVSPYVSYAKEYAVSIGLSLDITATECWDNPISANPNRSGIKSDIESRLNRYKNSEGFTAVWIWTEKLSDTDYNIYIGYC